MASNVRVDVRIDQKKLEHAVYFAPGTGSKISKATSRIQAKANSIASGYRTPKWHDHSTGKTKGDTPANYAGNTRIDKKGYIGIVYTGNYAAQKENREHNTLLKAKG